MKTRRIDRDTYRVEGTDIFIRRDVGFVIGRNGLRRDVTDWRVGVEGLPSTLSPTLRDAKRKALNIYTRMYPERVIQSAYALQSGDVQDTEPA